jgi:methylmalonyl-CoA mutase
MAAEPRFCWNWTQGTEATGMTFTDGMTPWVKAAERALKGASPDALASTTFDGVTIAPLYGPTSGAARAEALMRARREPGWDVRAEITAGDPLAANRQALEALAGGCSSLLLHAGLSGVESGEDLKRALDGVVLEAAPVALDAGFAGPLAAGWPAEAAKDAPSARLAFHLDPLGAFAAAGQSPGPIEAHVARAASVAAGLAGTYPEVSLFLASGRAVHEAGGSAAQELGVMASAALAYAKALGEAGLATPEAFARLVLGVAADADYLISIAKLRAAREIWARMTAACAVQAPARIEVRSSRRMLTAADPWTNLLRLTVAGFAGAAGGADALVLGAFTDALGPPGERAARLARNTQLILMDESGLGRVEDPAAGAFALEALTEQLARQGWKVFQAIETEGGLAAALTSGLIERDLAEVRKARHLAVAEDRTPILGVTRYPDPAPVTVELGEGAPAAPAEWPADVRLPGPDSRCPALHPMRLSETAEFVAEDLTP